MEYQLQSKSCQNCKGNFIIDADDFSFYEKIKVPAPTFCPECRMIRRFNYRNEQVLFRRKDSHSGEMIFSGISPGANVLTYENSYWFGGDWDYLGTGVDYDFTRNFFEQYRDLLARAPLPSRSVYNMLNSDYCNEASECKNAYLCFNTDFSENSAYIRKSRGVKDSFDSFELSESELCYENVLVKKGYNIFYSLDCENCVDVWFSKGLRGCTNCFGCVNLVNKTNHYFNESLSKEEYNEKIKKFNSGSYQKIIEIQKKALSFWLNYPNKFYHGLRVVNSTGERIYNSKNIKNCYYVQSGENLRFCQDMWPKASNSYDYSVWGDGAENVYECMTCGQGCYNLKFCFNCWEEVQNLEYCAYCIGSKNCFGCAGLYKKEYCILNKQYSKEEYEKLTPKIIEQMNKIPYVDSVGRTYKYGEFFPYDLSPIAYNESLAQDFFPIDQKLAEKKGLIWRDQNLREFEITIDSKNLPDDIKDVGDNLLKEIIKCENCSRAYRIIPLELQFYRRIRLPIPHLCIDCRFLKRFKLVNPLKLWQRSCMCDKANHFHGNEKCEVEFETSYSPEQPDVVFCEKCYQQEVI